jgi:hypothetical protein
MICSWSRYLFNFEDFNVTWVSKYQVKLNWYCIPLVSKCSEITETESPIHQYMGCEWCDLIKIVWHCIRKVSDLTSYQQVLSIIFVYVLIKAFQGHSSDVVKGQHLNANNAALRHSNVNKL